MGLFRRVVRFFSKRRDLKDMREDIVVYVLRSEFALVDHNLKAKAVKRKRYKLK